MTPPPTIRRAEDTVDINAVADLVAWSFNDLGPCEYLVEDPVERVIRMRAYFAQLTEHAAEHGEVLLTNDLSAAAVWFDRTKDMPAPPEYERRVNYLAGPHLERFTALDEVLDSNHPEEPHWHLAFLAVAPNRQGEGLGSLLMQQTHPRLDQTGTDAYLEATNEANRKLYMRHGYEDMNPCDIRLPDGTPFYRMWRRPGAGL